jgi:hypothetical protein
MDHETELTAIHALSTHEARHDMLHSTLSKHDFMARHRRWRAMTAADLTLLAEEDGKLQGFVFAVPDLLQEERREPVDTLIIREVCVRSGRRADAVRASLLCQVYERARKRGLRRVIHALVPDDKPGPTAGEVIRQYALFARGI